MNKAIPSIQTTVPKGIKVHQTRMLYTLSSFSEPRPGWLHSSFNEPLHFVYKGWHLQQPHHLHSVSSVARENFMKLPDSRIMSPKTECQHPTATWDEDYDEYNLHITPHQVTNRCGHTHGVFEPAEPIDLFDIHLGLLFCYAMSIL